MGDEIVTQFVLLLWGGIFAGLTVGGLLDWRAGFQWGLGVGCLQGSLCIACRPEDLRPGGSRH